MVASGDEKGVRAMWGSDPIARFGQTDAGARRMRPVAPPSGRAAISSNAVRAQPVAAAANEAMSGKVRSGRAAAGGVAPAPGRS